MDINKIKHLLKKLEVRILSRRDKNIRTNLRAFRATVDPAAIEAAFRPTEFRDQIEVLIPCYNHGSYLEESFGSVVAQTWGQPLYVTFIDDHSTDGSAEVMEKIRKAAPKRISVKIIHNEKNLLQGGSINRAIASSDAKLFVILNADDLLIPDCLEKTVSTYLREPSIYMLGGRSLWFEDANDLPPFQPQPIDQIPLKVFTPDEALDFTAPNDLHMSQSSCSFFRSAWEVVGGYFPRRDRVCSYDDRDFQLRVSSCFPVGVLDYPMEFYRTTSSKGRALN